jgi:hypothetical protein
LCGISLSEFKELIPFYGNYVSYKRGYGSKYDLFLSWSILFILLVRGWIEIYPDWFADFICTSVTIACSFGFIDSHVKNKKDIWIKRIGFSFFFYLFSLVYIFRSLNGDSKSIIHAILAVLFLLLAISRIIYEARRRGLD